MKFKGKEYPSRTKETADVAMIDPFTLRIYTLPVGYPLETEMALHEWRHIEQVRRDGCRRFILRYLKWLIRYGYEKNPYEIEARQAEKG